jgi:glucose dehydrogenase
VHTSFPNIVYALDLAKEGAPLIWKYIPQQSPDAIPIACCDLVNRGTAYHQSGKIYINALQGDLIALDAKTGKELWKARHPKSSPTQVEAQDYKDGATITVAPIVIKDIVINGISGGEFGVRGRVSAFDANTGKHMWTAYSTGPDSETLVPEVANANYASHRARTSASPPGKATSGRRAAGRPGAGSPTTPS